MPSMTAIPNNAMKPIAAETLNGVPVSNSAKMPPIMAIGMTAMPSSVSVNEAKLTYSNTPISRMVSGTITLRRLIASCRLPNSPDPFQTVARGQRDFIGNPALRLEHGAAEVAPAHAEFDRNVALLLLAVDEGGARSRG